MPVKNKAGQLVALEPEVEAIPREQHAHRVCVDDLSLSDDQSVAYAKILFWVRSRRPLFYLGGHAGTGKTSIAARLCSDVSSIVFCAFTGKAASVLRSKLWGTGSLAEVSTIHSLIYLPDKEASKHNRGEKYWVLKRELSVAPQLIVVDEASMLTTKMLRDLLSFKIPVLLLGDPMQLPPVGGEEISLDNVPEHASLTRIHRQAEGSAVLRLANGIREGMDYVDVSARCGVPMVTLRQFPRALREAYEEYGVGDVGVLCYRNETRLALNDIGQEVHRATAGDVARDQQFFRGMPVMNLYNYSARILNGMRGFIEEAEVDSWWLSGKFNFYDEGVSITGDAFGPQFDSEKAYDSLDECERFFEKEDPSVRLNPDTWRDDMGLLLDYAYAMTTHKSQGSQFKKVFLKVERPPGIDDLSFRRWLYTSVTRASESLTLVGG